MSLDVVVGVQYPIGRVGHLIHDDHRIGDSHVIVMVVKVVLMACSPLTGPGAKVKTNT